MKKFVLTIALVLIYSTQLTFAQSQANFPTPSQDQAVDESLPTHYYRLIAPSPIGTIGLFHTISAETQPAGPTSIGISFAGNYFSKDEFPQSFNKTSRLIYGFNILYTPAEWLETFLGTNFLSTNDDPKPNAKISETLNLNFGAKLSFPLSTNWRAGLVYAGQERSNLTTIPGSVYSLNHRLSLLGTYDPVKNYRLHANLGIEVNNNDRLIYHSTDQRNISVLYVYKNNLMPIALGGEYLFTWASVSLEYSMDYVFSSGEGFGGQPQRITFGGNFFPTQSRALAAQLGIDLGLSSTSSTTFIKEPPFALLVGLSYLFGVQKQNSMPGPVFTTKDNEFSKRTSTDKVSPNTRGPGHVSGYITNIETGDPIIGAKIYFCSDPDNAVVTDTLGQYHSSALPNGSCVIRIEHPDYRSSKETVQVSDDAEQSFDFGLLQQTMEKGTLLIRVKDKDGNPTAATILFPQQSEIESVKTNEFGQTKIDIKPGTYLIQAKTKTAGLQNKNVTLNSKQKLFVDFKVSLANKDSTPTIEAKTVDKPIVKKSSGSISISKDGKQIIILPKITFAPGKTIATPDSLITLNSVAEFLKNHAEIKKIQIRGHTDTGGNEKKNQDLSDDRADVIGSYLTKKGIDSKRIDTKGYGSKKPIAPNDTKENREKNRRVEFIILSLPKTK